MWSIDMLKENAKRMLSGYYWVAFGATLIFSLLAGGLLSQYQGDSGTSVTADLNEIMAEQGIETEFDYNFESEEDIERFFNDFVAGLEDGESETDDYAFDEDFAFGTEETPDTESGMTGDEAIASSVEAVLAGIGIAVLVIVLIAMIGSLLYQLLFANAITVGHNRFYLDARMGNAQVTNLFSQFGSGRYGNTIKTMFIYDLKLFLWGLLGAIPFIFWAATLPGTFENFGTDMNEKQFMAYIMEMMGGLVLAALAYGIFMIPQLIKRYSYVLVPYILAENPNIPQKRAFEISVKTMNGEKAHFFGLEISFIGWYILAALAGSILGGIVGTGLGSIITILAISFVYPYVYATYTEFYCCMREKAMAQGIASSDELNGVFGTASSGMPYPEQNPADFMPYQRTDSGSSASGSYPAYQPANVQNDVTVGKMDEIVSEPETENRISLEKKDSDDNNYNGPEIM